jgi:hypothetical protein
MGIRISRMAFSWTCHENKNELNEDKMRASTNVSGLGFHQSFQRIGCVNKMNTNWEKTVSNNAASGVISGRTANVVSPTNPRVR